MSVINRSLDHSRGFTQSDTQHYLYSAPALRPESFTTQFRLPIDKTRWALDTQILITIPIPQGSHIAIHVEANVEAIISSHDLPANLRQKIHRLRVGAWAHHKQKHHRRQVAASFYSIDILWVGWGVVVVSNGKRVWLKENPQSAWRHDTVFVLCTASPLIGEAKLWFKHGRKQRRNTETDAARADIFQCGRRGSSMTACRERKSRSRRFRVIAWLDEPATKPLNRSLCGFCPATRNLLTIDIYI